MTTKVRKEPGSGHPITIEPSAEHVVVRSGETVIADTRAALVLREATIPPVYYVPLSDVDQALLRPSTHATYCPFKGDASYYTVAAGDRELQDAIWFYADPYPAVAQIKDHVAFYTTKVDLTVEA
jgi:uncharacterized protein (DUF427 family)